MLKHNVIVWLVGLTRQNLEERSWLWDKNGGHNLQAQHSVIIGEEIYKGFSYMEKGQSGPTAQVGLKWVMEKDCAFQPFLNERVRQKLAISTLGSI